MNDRNDFAPAVRDGAWWSGDSRMAANGRANQAVLTKLGLMERPDLSGVEAVQMGHVMEPVIGRLVQERLGIELRDADYALQHPKEAWLKSHFDFITTDGKTLVEAKNYNGMTRNKFSEESNIIPAADMAQLIHESACHGVDNVILAVLFGGNELVTFDFTITDQQREDLIKEMAVYWAAVQTQTPLPPENSEQARRTWPVDRPGSVVTATQEIERVALRLKQIKASIKGAEEEEERLLIAMQKVMSDHAEMVTVDGTVLATWKAAKSTKRFDPKLFQSSMPDLYAKYVVDVPGSRRFLIK